MSTELQHRDAMSTADLLSSPDKMQALVSFADMMSKAGNMIPDHFKGKPSDCMAIVMQAANWGMSPWSVAQGTHIVSGTLGFEAKLVNAVISSSTAIEGRFHYRYNTEDKWVVNGKKVGPECWIQCGAILKGESEIQWGERLYPDDVTTKNSPLWQTAPKQQSAYLAVKYWARLYCPQVMLGIHTTDEILDNPQYSEEKVINPNESAIRRPAISDQDAVTDEPVIDQPEIELIPLDDLGQMMLDAGDIDALDAVRVDAQKHDYESNKDQVSDIVAIYKERKAEMLRDIDEANLSANGGSDA